MNLKSSGEFKADAAIISVHGACAVDIAADMPHIRMV
jgi:hypothetical protein